MQTLKTLANKIPIAITSQCIYGRINHNVYEAGKKLKNIGILGHLTDITSETAYIKLAWLLSQNKTFSSAKGQLATAQHKLNHIKNLYQENIKNEISERIKK